jgi:PDDEXK-like domain of unknown function (DUF3799)
MNYYQIKRVSNSDLSRLKAQFAGKTIWYSQQAMSFGKALHEVLETPDVSQAPVQGVDNQLIKQLADKVTASSEKQAWLEEARREEVIEFTDATTQLACKARLDVFSPDFSEGTYTVVDYKTTSARNRMDFIRSCSIYDYDRQAAFYLDGVRQSQPELGEGTFIFVGIQKVEPYDLFFFETRHDSSFIEQGRRKYRYWLDKWKDFGGLLSRNEGNISLTDYDAATDFFAKAS